MGTQRSRQQLGLSVWAIAPTAGMMTEAEQGPHMLRREDRSATSGYNNEDAAVHIRAVKIKNIRGFSELELDFDRGEGRSLAGWTVIAGRNGAGKTTLLRAIAMASVGPNNAMRLMESFRGWVRTEQTSGEISLVVQAGVSDLDFDKKSHRGTVYQTRHGKEHLDMMMTWQHDPKNRSEPTVGGQHSSNQPDPFQSIWYNFSHNNWFIAGYGPFRRTSGATSDADRLTSGPAKVSRLVTLFREDAALMEAVGWLQGVHTRALEQKNDAEAVKAGVLQLLGDGLLPEGTSVLDVDSDGLWVQQGDLRLPLQELSDGYRVAAALVLDLVRLLLTTASPENAPALIVEHNGHPAIRSEGVVLIDEVDAHLHISWQKQIGFWLTEHFPNIQFIVTTHSPFICQAADPGGLFLLPGPGDASPARKLTGEEHWRIVNGSADDVALSPLFGLERVHSEAAERLREELAELEMELLQPSPSPEAIARYKALRVRLPDPAFRLLLAQGRKP